MDVSRAFKILELASDAGLEDVKQSYKELVFIWHPDRHSGNSQAQARASRKMAELNEAYETLRSYFASGSTFLCPVCGLGNQVPDTQTGTVLRCGRCGSEVILHRTREGKDKDRPKSAQRGGKTPSRKAEESLKAGSPYRVLKRTHPVAAKLAGGALLCFLAAGLAYTVFSHYRAADLPEQKPEKHIAISEPLRKYVKPPLAPNGRPWPLNSGYLQDYPEESSPGLSTITVDNAQSSADVLVKLFSLDTDTPVAVRVFFIRAGSRFAVRNIPAGTYDIRYQNLNTGYLSKSESFTLTEQNEAESVRASSIEITLYSVPRGSMKTYLINKEDF